MANKKPPVGAGKKTKVMPESQPMGSRKGLGVKKGL